MLPLNLHKIAFVWKKSAVQSAGNGYRQKDVMKLRSTSHRNLFRLLHQDRDHRTAFWMLLLQLVKAEAFLQQ